MSENSAIEWCHHTFNPWWGCARVSPGCVNCYADTWAKRSGHGGLWRRHGERRFFGDDYWHNPVKWNRAASQAGERRRVFCASMADVFEAHPEREMRNRMNAERARLWTLVERTPWLDWLLLTKRPEYIGGMVPAGWIDSGWPSNVWVGTSVEDQRRADERIPLLLSVSPAIRFLSCEPLIAPVDLQKYLPRGVSYPTDYGTGIEHDLDRNDAIDWCIVGGESGGHAREMSVTWVRFLIEQCRASGAAPFVKQLGAVWARGHRDEWTHPDLRSDVKGGNWEAWPEDLRVREFPRVPATMAG